MDIVAAISTIGQAINIAKGLREIQDDFSSAAYKAQMAELYGALADVKMALSDAKEALHEKDKQIRELKDALESSKSGEQCPMCDEGRMKVTASRPHPHFSFAGVQERTVTCQNSACGHSEARLYDPNKTAEKSNR